MAPFGSYERLLRKYMNLKNPRVILEYGPGFSTEIMAEYPNTQIISIEHDPVYFADARNRWRVTQKVSVVHLNYREGYVGFAEGLKLKFDLVFVDGFCDWRVDCLKHAVNVLAPDGIVILHDSEREKYAEGRLPFELIEESEGTAVFKLPMKNDGLNLTQKRGVI